MKNGIIGFAIGFLIGYIVTPICSDKKEQKKEESGALVPSTPTQKVELPKDVPLQQPIEDDPYEPENVPYFIDPDQGIQSTFSNTSNSNFDEEDKAFQDLREDNPIDDRRWATNRNVCLINEDELEDSGYEIRHITYYNDGVFADSDNDEVKIHLRDAEEWFAISNFMELLQNAPVYTELFIRSYETERDYVIEKEGVPYSVILEEKTYLKNRREDDV